MTGLFPKRVLAADPFSRGVGFAVLEGPDDLIELALKSTGRADNKKSARLIEALIARFDPETLALEDWRAAGSRRCYRIRQLLQRISVIYVKRVRVRLITRNQLRRIGPPPPASTKYGRACLLAERFTELRPLLPPFRKPWMAEDDRMAIFDAVAFAVACFAAQHVQTPTAASQFRKSSDLRTFTP